MTNPCDKCKRKHTKDERCERCYPRKDYEKALKKKGRGKYESKT